MRATRLRVWNEILRTRLVPIHADDDAERAVAVLGACVEGGVRVFEFTDRKPGSLAVFAAVRRHFDAEAPAVILGAGTVWDAETAAAYVARGAEFIVSPAFDSDTARLCNRRGVAYLPGCATPTEIARAQEAGSEIVKLFPAADLGPGFVKRVLGPAPRTRLLPTGGLAADEDTLRRWREAGAVGAGLGSSLIGDPDEARTRPDALSGRCRAALDVLTRHGARDDAL